VSEARPEVASFLARAFPGSRLIHLTGDGSTRSFLRLVPASGSSRIVMDYGKPIQAPTDDERLARVFERAALPVPAILECHPEVGILLLEDVGDDSLESVLLADRAGFAADREPPKLLVRAVELAAEVGRLGSPALAASDRANGPALDAERFRYEMSFFLKHFVAGHLRRPNVDRALESALFELADRAAKGPTVLCHRDFHSRNLMVRSGDLVMVDIQDARWGPDTYDLASIVRDAYLPIPEKWVGVLVKRFVDRFGSVENLHSFFERFLLVATQRMIKALGSFGYLAHAKNPRYLASIGPTVARLRTAMPNHPQTAALLERLEAAGALPPNDQVAEE
jgi:N-acetylmuramate 1-kinase